MRVRDHIALTTTGAALARPWLRNGVVGFWAGGVLVDVDHYLWFSLRERRASPLAAMRFFNEAHPPQHAATRVLHSPLIPIAALILGLRRRALIPLGLGMALHIVLDRVHDAHMDRARALALERDAFVCQVCGLQAADVGTHLQRQPWLLPSYELENLVALCDPCHDAAHADAGVAA
jgi:5-methylcytosine-specific restriction endonuclease McrA